MAGRDHSYDYKGHENMGYEQLPSYSEVAGAAEPYTGNPSSWAELTEKSFTMAPDTGVSHTATQHADKSYTEKPYTMPSSPAPPYSSAPYPGPSQAEDYRGTPYSWATHAGPPYPGAPFSQQSSRTVVVQPMSSVGVTVVQAPPTHMGLAIFSCICCFPLAGIVAIVFSCLADSANTNRNYTEAAWYSKGSRLASIISIVVGIIEIIIISVLLSQNINVYKY